MELSTFLMGISFGILACGFLGGPITAQLIGSGFGQLFSNQGFWIALGAVGSMSAVIVALRKPVFSFLFPGNPSITIEPFLDRVVTMERLSAHFSGWIDVRLENRSWCTPIQDTELRLIAHKKLVPPTTESPIQRQHAPLRLGRPFSRDTLWTIAPHGFAPVRLLHLRPQNGVVEVSCCTVDEHPDPRWTFREVGTLILGIEVAAANLNRSKYFRIKVERYGEPQLANVLGEDNPATVTVRGGETIYDFPFSIRISVESVSSREKAIRT